LSAAAASVICAKPIQLLGIMLDELHGWHVAFDAYGRGGLRPTHRNIIARSTRRLIKCAHIRRCHCDSKGMLISREVFLRTEGRAA
jgi:hypothetical protein